MPRGWKPLAEYSKSGFNKLKRKCLSSSSDDNSEVESIPSETSVDNSDCNQCEENVEPTAHHPRSNGYSAEGSPGSFESSERESEHVVLNRGCDSISIENEDEHDYLREPEANQDCLSDINSNSSSNLSSGRNFGSSGNSASDSDSSEHSIDNLAEPRIHEPLYEGAQLTVQEHVVATMAMIVRHNMTKALQSDLLKYAKLHCPVENQCTKSLYTFEKEFVDCKIPLVRHYYCTTCYRGLEDRKSICGTCARLTKANYFVEVSTREQIKAVWKRKGLWTVLQNQRMMVLTRNPNEYSDITSIYQNLLNQDNGFLNNNPANITLTMNTDGVSIFKSSKFNIWPIYFTINELPFDMRMRKENVILAALWFGDACVKKRVWEKYC